MTDALEVADAQLHRVRRLCAALPETWEKLSHGAPTFFAGKRVFAMFVDNHHSDGHLGIWLAAEMADQQAFVDGDPATYFVPPYVGCKGWVGVELTQVDDDLLSHHLRQAWQLIMRKQKKGKKPKQTREFR